MPNSAVTEENSYNIAHWGEGYFAINERGNIEVCKTSNSPGVELQAIVNAASRAGLQLPLLIRFIDILQDRVAKIYNAFEEAIEEIQYQGRYTLVYPIKVNQEQCVVRELLKAKNPVGLEAGSKPELMAALGMLGKNPSTIICNGYKDRAYIRIALIAQQMGHEVFIVLEKRSELDIILRESSRMGIKPKLGMRIRLINKSAGKWENTGGAKSKFGLNAEQVLEAVHKLKENDALDALQLMHCHLGSQIANIHDIRNCMQEVARYYVELRHLDAPISTIDVGGGLSVDYEGTHVSVGCSMNYSLKEYASNILLAIRQLTNDTGMPEPNIISESGRALTAHHAVLVSNITDVEIVKKSTSNPSIADSDSHVIRDIVTTYESLNDRPAKESYNYASHSLQEAHALFQHGVISLEEKAKVERVFTNLCLDLQDRLDDKNPGEAELKALLNERMAAKIFCNLSFFQSLPDAWAIAQIFPVAPLTQLSEPASMQSILQDLTCDSDGTLKQYTGRASIDSTLGLPPYNPNQPYALAFFLVGAYQEILGNLHNLFGDTNSLDVTLQEAGQFEINDLVSGDTITNVLNFAHYDTKRLIQSYEKQLINTNLSEDTIDTYLTELRSHFSQLTYLDNTKLKG